ncbi:LysE family translocator [Roseococcus sp. SDR]|uniref:LysE family translocator n=1 Tax=Roseococcus sp. SDR TaxID=2835532 RepID=UPI001BD11559|nr:LysE family translocator [Roseococcus sp. SDR]MBS7789600.1 LysE family translocator [Roseococcus sp. SDR]MBV1844914.1 LysE family translocator [Roseococcus sp. SDR]
MAAEQFWLFLAAASLLPLTPGPGMFYVGARTLSGGLGEGIASTIGTGLGGLVHVLAAAFGLSALILASAEVFTVMKLLGGCYLVWLGWRSWREAGAPMPLGTPLPALGLWRAFREGAVVEALNPKTALFFLAFLPQFVAPERGDVIGQFLLLGGICVALNTLVDAGVALAAGRVRGELGQRPGLLRRLRQGSAALIMSLGLGVLLLRRPAG